MPLCTILTKCPAPDGPQCRKPCSAGAGTPERPRVRGADSTPGADHQAIAALEPGDAAARADVDVVLTRGTERFGAPDVVAVVRIAAVDDDVAGIEVRLQLLDRVVDGGGRHHQPDCPRSGRLRRQLGERCCAGRAFLLQRRHCRRLRVMDDAPMTPGHQPPHHAGTHSTQADHCELHSCSPLSAATLSDRSTRRIDVELETTMPAQAETAHVRPARVDIIGHRADQATPWHERHKKPNRRALVGTVRPAAKPGRPAQLAA